MGKPKKLPQIPCPWGTTDHRYGLVPPRTHLSSQQVPAGCCQSFWWQFPTRIFQNSSQSIFRLMDLRPQPLHHPKIHSPPLPRTLCQPQPCFRPKSSLGPLSTFLPSPHHLLCHPRLEPAEWPSLRSQKEVQSLTLTESQWPQWPWM